MKNFDFIPTKKESPVKNNIQIKKRTFILMTLSFIILNFFIASFLNVQHIKKETKSNYFLTADFQREVSATNKEKTEIEILKLDGVKKVRYVSKEEAFQKLQYELDIAIPRSENPLSDTLIIYFDSPKDIENIQNTLENNKSIKESFSDATYITHIETEDKFYTKLAIAIIVACILPMVIIIYLTYYTSISIDYINHINIMKNDKKLKTRAKRMNALPLIASNIIGTLIFFNMYIYFRNHLLLLGNRYLILSLKEIVFVQVIILIVINLILLVSPVKTQVFQKEES